VTPAEPVLEVANLSKDFPGNRVLNEISFEVLAGEIHALVGENGCGKSTFIKCLAGVQAPEPGAEIQVAGERLPDGYGPEVAFAYGLSFIHQNLGLVLSLSVLENLALTRGFATRWPWRIDWKRERDRAREALAQFAPHIDVDRRVRDLTQSDRTLVAIARGLQSGGARQSRLLVLDEPTAALPEAEVELLFAALRRVVAKGVGIVFVSHRLNEILTLADRVTAFRDGRNVGTRAIAGLSEQELVEIIIGRPLSAYYPPQISSAKDDSLLTVDGLSGKRVQGATFQIHRGEVVGLAGLLGSGRSELGRLIYGAQARTAGATTLAESAVSPRSPGEALRAGIGYVPQDRLGQGGVGRLNVAENITLPDLSEFWRHGRLHKADELRAARALMERFNVRPRNPAARFRTLSGGNQQKAIIARLFRLPLKLIILDEPVQGVDIGSKTEIYRLIDQAAAEGRAVLLIDSDFEDLCRLCHRIMVMRQGRIVAELSGEAKTPERITELVYLSSERQAA
jgi:ribose transport system ATP-binding protein